MERIHYIEMCDEDSSDELSFEFSRGLTELEFDKFVELMNENEVPLDSADMYEDMDGIDIHLDDKVSSFEITKAKENMNKILSDIAADLKVID